MKKIILLMIISAFLFSGCSTTMPLNYVASPSIKGQGQVGVGVFNYIPADNKIVKSNEFQKAPLAMGTMYMPENANTLLKNSIKKELIAAGFDQSEDASLKISGDIDKFEYDWVGVMEVNFYLDVSYKVTDGGKTVYEKTIKTHKASPKVLGSTDSEAVRSTISDNITELLQDLRSKKIL